MGVDIDDVAAWRPRSDHVRGPVHEPEPDSRRYGFVRRDGQPGKVLTALHPRLEPRQEMPGHGVQGRVIAMSHIREHGASMARDDGGFGAVGRTDFISWGRHACSRYRTMGIH